MREKFLDATGSHLSGKVMQTEQTDLWNWTISRNIWVQRVNILTSGKSTSTKSMRIVIILNVKTCFHSGEIVDFNIYGMSTSLLA